MTLRSIGRNANAPFSLFDPPPMRCVALSFIILLGCGRPMSEDRVAVAKARAGSQIQAKFTAAKIKFPPREIYIRAFKKERELELWATDKKGGKLTKVHTWDVAAASGELGPKRIQGDKQVPEGFYEINRFNPQSRFWLSLGLNYPNASDKILSDRAKPGSDIFIHGSNVSIGCLAMTDEVIDEIYLAALAARDNGQRHIRVDIFPARAIQGLRSTPATEELWSVLEQALARFEKTRRPVNFRVDSKGQYVLLAKG